MRPKKIGALLPIVAVTALWLGQSMALAQDEIVVAAQQDALVNRSTAMAMEALAQGCPRVCSAFGAHTRCDGSIRSRRYPVHHGIDIATPEGTPLLAVADGIIVTSHTGPSIGGIMLVVQHPPAAAKAESYVYAVYKHLQSRSPLSPGTKVSKGQRIATSGKTGTVGGYFGSAGFPHLHFETHINAEARWPSGQLANPLPFLSRVGGWPLRCR
jgi:murein DD-endopeptidase MepM/ murein hydrolase activator NlpD